MQVQMQKCNGCGAFNTASDVKWVRVFGVSPGPAPMPIQPRNQIDVCPACASTVTIDKLPAMAVAAVRAA